MGEIEFPMEEMKNAWADVPYPGDDQLISHNCLECEEIQSYFRGRGPWDNFPVQGLRYHSAALSLFSPKAYQYFLPAFMLADYRDSETSDIIGECIVYDFGLSASDEWLAPRLALFTDSQKYVIWVFCQYVDGGYGQFKEYLGKARVCLGINLD